MKIKKNKIIVFKAFVFETIEFENLLIFKFYLPQSRL